MSANRTCPASSVFAVRPSKPPLRLTATSERGSPELVMTWIVTGPSFRAAPGSVGDDTGFAADGAVAEPPHAVSARTALARSPPHAARVACDLTGCLHMIRYSSRNSGFRVATGGAIGPV